MARRDGPERPRATRSDDDLARAFAASFTADVRSPALPPVAEAPVAPVDVLTVDECGRWLGVNRKTVYDAANRRELPCARIGRRVLLSRPAIEAWLAGRRQ